MFLRLIRYRITCCRKAEFRAFHFYTQHQGKPPELQCNLNFRRQVRLYRNALYSILPASSSKVTSTSSLMVIFCGLK